MDELQPRRVHFNKRPIPLPADYRPMYKIALIVLILKYACRSETSNLLKLHLISWSLVSEKNTEQLRRFIESNYKSDLSVWGIEPTLNRALQLAIAEKICEVIEGKKYKLTKKGNRFFEQINADSELLDKEKAFLVFIGKNTITDSRITAMTQKWTLFYVEN